MLYTSAAEAAASLQLGLSRALANGELLAEEVKLLEFIYHDFLYLVDSEEKMSY